MVRGIEIARSDIFDAEESTTWPRRLANGLHVITRDGVVRRELLFRVGDRYQAASVAESARNLRSLGIFRSVTIDSVTTDSGLVVRVVTKDGWSTRPDFGLGSIGGQLTYSLEFVEDNFLGTASRFRVLGAKDPDRSGARLSLWAPRAIGNRVGLDLSSAVNSDGHRLQLFAVSPFLSLSSRFGGWVGVQDIRERLYLSPVAGGLTRDTVDHRLTEVDFSAGWALAARSAGYLRVGLSGRVRDETPSSRTADRFGTSRVGFGPFVEISRARFAVIRGYRSFGRDEDVDLSTGLRVDVLAAPPWLGSPRGALEATITAGTGHSLAGGFVRAAVRTTGRFEGSRVSSGLATGLIHLVQPIDERQLLVAAVRAGIERDPAVGFEFDLASGWGLRAFPVHTFTGDRAYSATVEYRWIALPSFARVVAIGVAGFADYGAGWYAGARRETGTDFGLGLRLYPSRSTEGNSVRLDLAHRAATSFAKSGWVVSAGKDFVFGTKP